MEPGDAIARLPQERRARQVLETVLLLAVIALVAIGLAWFLGRMGERIAVQLCLNICAIVALAVFSGNSGIVSFGHAAFLGIGAYLSGILTMPAVLQASVLPALPGFLAGHELTLFPALAATALAGLIFGLLTGLPIARLAGASATIATLGLLIIVHSVLVGARDITRGSQTFYGVPRLTTFEVAVGAAIAFVVIARLYRESRWGLALRAARDQEPAAVAIGINPRRARLIAWCLSAAMATVAGALYGHMLGAFSPRDFYFSMTFAMVAMLIVGGMTTVSGAVCGAILVTLLQDAVRQVEGGFTIVGLEVPQIFGLTTVALGIAILLVIFLKPDGIFGQREAGVGALAARVASRLPRGPEPASPAAVPRDTPPLAVRDLVKRFEGLSAVDGASFEVAPRQVTGLIGPNGAGKSTIVNLLTGQMPATSGDVRFGGEALTGMAPHRIARLGLARTFQNNRLFEKLTVYENVLVAALVSGLDARAAAARALRELVALDLLGHADTLASGLPYGARKRVEIARCLALEPRLILLDEPAAGMNPAETADLAVRLARLCEERGVGLLLIDHDLDFVNRLSSSIVVVST